MRHSSGAISWIFHALDSANMCIVETMLGYTAQWITRIYIAPINVTRKQRLQAFCTLPQVLAHPQLIFGKMQETGSLGSSTTDRSSYRRFFSLSEKDIVSSDVMEWPVTVIYTTEIATYLHRMHSICALTNNALCTKLENWERPLRKAIKSEEIYAV